MTEGCASKCDALRARVDALQTLLDEREDRTKERFIAMDKSVSSALAAADRAVVKAEVATEKRFEGVNEFRGTLSDQAGRLMPRAEYQVQYSAMTEKIDALAVIVNNRENLLRGRKDGLGLVGQIILGAIAAVSMAAAVTAAVVAISALHH